MCQAERFSQALDDLGAGDTIGSREKQSRLPAGADTVTLL